MHGVNPLNTDLTALPRTSTAIPSACCSLAERSSLPTMALIRSRRFFNTSLPIISIKANGDRSVASQSTIQFSTSWSTSTSMYVIRGPRHVCSLGNSCPAHYYHRFRSILLLQFKIERLFRRLHIEKYYSAFLPGYRSNVKKKRTSKYKL